jgi:hypothetical protein
MRSALVSDRFFPKAAARLNMQLYAQSRINGEGMSLVVGLSRANMSFF